MTDVKDFKLNNCLRWTFIEIEEAGGGAGLG